MECAEPYSQSLIRMQPQLNAYILALLGNAVAADDVLQETNLVLCRKEKEFVPGTNFNAWAFRIARLQCLAYWKVQARDRLVFDEAVISLIADSAEQRLTALGEYLPALRHCLETLTPRNRELLRSRYGSAGSVKRMAAEQGRTEPAISQMLYRVRQVLMQCIGNHLANHQGTADG